jgi:hypothetical protein
VKRIKYSFLKVVASEIEKGRSIISITNKVSLAQFRDNSNIHANFHTPTSAGQPRTPATTQDHEVYPDEYTRQGCLELHLGYQQLCLQEVLLTLLQINRSAKTVSMDLEVKSHKKAKDLHMAGFQR